MTQLPEIELICRNRHSFTSRARGGSSVSCPACRPARVSVWIPRDRPRTEREARERAEHDGQAEGPAAGSELAGRWERETPWPGKLVTLGGRAGDECPECEGPLQWEPGRTVTYCPACKRIRLPAAVAGHYRRQDQRSAEVAVRAEPDASVARAVRVRLNALKQRMADRVNEWVEVFDPEELSGGPLRLALDYRAELAAYLPEIRNAASEADLTEIMAEIGKVTDRANSSGALAQIERQREATERQAELAEYQAELAKQAEYEAREAERAQREAERRATIEAQQRKAIESRTARKPATASSPNGYAEGLTVIAGMIESNRRSKERKLAYGPCGYEHRKPTIPERRYWITTLDWQGNQSGYELPGSPAVVACRKHFAAADAWIQEQAALITRRNTVSIQAVHTELK